MDKQYTPKQARLLAEKSQTEIAEVMGICLQTYRKLEINPAEMTISQAKCFCSAVGRSMNEIFFGETLV